MFGEPPSSLVFGPLVRFVQKYTEGKIEDNLEDATDRCTVHDKIIRVIPLSRQTAQNAQVSTWDSKKWGWLSLGHWRGYGVPSNPHSNPTLKPRAFESACKLRTTV